MVRRGLPKAIAKKYGITKKAWQVYRGRKGRSSSRSSKTSKTTRKRRRNVVRRKKRRSRKFTLPVAAVLGATAGLWTRPVGGPETPLEIFMRGDFNWALHELTYNYTGWHGGSGRWMPQNAVGMWAAVAGFAVHWIASKLGINRMLGQARVPVFRI